MTLKSAGLYTLFTLLLLPSMPAICAEDEDNSPKPAKLFSTSETLTVTMTGPWKYIERHTKDQDAKPAKIDPRTVTMSANGKTNAFINLLTYPPALNSSISSFGIGGP